MPAVLIAMTNHSQLSLLTHRNHYLFSDYYLDHRVAGRREWREAEMQPQLAALADSGKTLHANPALQIDFYIRHTGLAWGVLTNGRLWQLFHKDTSKKLDVYYEVDLPALIEAGDVEAFKYFWLFFRREAFTPGTAAPGAATLQAIHDNSLIVLYRLLLILYAEDRDLLPVQENVAYRESYSLLALKRRIAQEIDGGKQAAPNMSGLWQRLIELWRVIDAGDPYLSVPAYDGGLFKPAHHPFLEQHRVGDLHLRRAIDLLARTREFVDYRDLEIRHLGSIYEGLLEYQVRVASEPLVVRKEKGREVFETLPTGPIPQVGPVPKPDLLPGQVYLKSKASCRYQDPILTFRKSCSPLPC